MIDKKTFKLGELEVEVKQAKLKTWFRLDFLQDQIITATDIDKQAHSVCEFVSVAVDVSIDTVENAPWRDVAQIYDTVLRMNSDIPELPYMRQTVKKNLEEVSYNYPGRPWWSVANMLAERFGWTLDYIAELQVSDAFYLIQEILISRQLREEWEWTLSERAVGYDEATKKNKFIPLERPDWMKPVVKPPKPVKIPAHLIPAGLIIHHGDRNVIN